MINISHFIGFHARLNGRRSAIIYNGQIIHYEELHNRILKVAGWLQANSIGAGDVVALLMKNSPAFLELTFAVSHVGGVLLPINFRLSGDEVSYIAENAGAKLLIHDEELAVAAATSCRRLELAADAQVNFAASLGDVPAARLMPRHEDDIFRLMYTSGTTDRPKGVIHTYSNFYWKSTAHAIALELTSQTRLLVAGPLYHVGAFDLPGIAVLRHGGCLLLHRDFQPELVLASIERDRPDGAWLAPVMTGQILTSAPTSGCDLSSLRWVIAGGERTPEARVNAFQQCFPSARYIDAYGLTETCSGDTLMPSGYEISKIGSAGVPIPHVEISIRDDSGVELPTEAEGEICIRGPKVFSGYWQDPDKTAASFFGEWFRSGDIGLLDSDGFLYITDRKKDMILSGGENIAASEIERVLHEHPAVGDVAVIGMPDERWGERPVAHVVPAPGKESDAAALIAHCRSKLAGFKVPAMIIFRQDLPRNPSGKILKRVLREEAISEID